MASLLSLANETILQIIDEARPDGIWGLVRCCKRLWILGADDLKQHRRDVARYRVPIFTFRKEQAFGVDVFLSAILHQPRRALYVNHLWVLDYASGLELDPVLITKKSLRALDDIRNLIFTTDGCPYIQDDEVGKWVDRIERGDVNAILCLSLTLLPNVQKLIFGYDDDQYTEMIYKISKLNQSPYCKIPGPLSLGRLETIRFKSTMNNESGICEACMTLPSLRKLEGAWISLAFDHWPSNEEFSSESRVTEIDFQESAINADAFTRLLTRAKSLERLTYSFYRLVDISGDFTVLSLKHVLEQHSARTLTHLDLDFNVHNWVHRGRSIGSLSCFRALKHLRVAASIFIDEVSPQIVDLLPLLPSSLETLILLPQAVDTFTLGGLRSKKKECLPNLKEIICEGGGNIFVDDFEEECASVGIDFAYFSEHHLVRDKRRGLAWRDY